MDGHGGPRRVALVFWDGYLGVAPSLVGGIGALVERGCQVDVLLRAPEEGFPPPPAFAAEQVRVTLMPRTWPGARGALLARVAEYIDRARFHRLCRRWRQDASYDLVIGVDDEGVVAGAELAGADTPLVYWSLELDPYLGSIDPGRQWVRAAARRLRTRAALFLVQDEARARVLTVGVPGAMSRVRLVPNVPPGPAFTRESRWFHERLQLPAGQRVILHAGAILPEMCIPEIAAAAASWPADWTLVLHERIRRSPDEPDLVRLVHAGGGRVRLSLEPVPIGTLGELFAGADVCLAFYSSRHGDNFHLMANASGKLAYALQAGVPVVCSRASGFEPLIERWGCGAVVDDVAEIQGAIRSILADLPGHRIRARTCFQEVFEFSGAFAPVLDDLLALRRGTALR